LANPSTRYPPLPNLSFASLNFLSHDSSFATGTPSFKICVHRSHIFYGAPLVKTQYSLSGLWYSFTLKAYLFVELNGILHSRFSLSLAHGNCLRVSLMSAMGWKNLIRAVSEASPVVGMSRYSMVLRFCSQVSLASETLSCFSLSVRFLLLLIELILSAGILRSNSATEQTIALSWRALNPAS
jgi:hypothetical protein